MKEFSKRLNYTFGNEDPETESKALQIQPDSRILCITASGDRPLNLLVHPCKEMIAVDVNPMQNHLLHLKSAAMRTLDYESYLAFLGAKKSSQRYQVLGSILKELSLESQLFWQLNKHWIGKGILYQGRIESITKFTAFILGSKKNKQLFKFNCLEEQKEFVAKNWDSTLIRKALEFVLSPKIAKFILNDPGLYAHLAPGTNLGTYLYDRMLELLNTRLAKESILLSLIFQGYVEPEGLSPYLHQNTFETIRGRLHLLGAHTGDVIHFLKNKPEACIDRFSLSDIASYMPQDTFNLLIEEVFRTASPGARFCIRQLSSNHEIPKEFAEKFQREPALEQELDRQDHCFVYRFMTGTIKK